MLNEDHPELQQKISTEGWGKKFLEKQGENGHWGLSFYQPKWISTHYTLLDLRYLEISPSISKITGIIESIIKKNINTDGGINAGKTVIHSDVCINGMFLNYASYFKIDEEKLHSIVDFLISQQMQDGGFNCRSNREGAKHSSLHTTLSVIEGINEYRRNGYKYRLQELNQAEAESIEFMLQHQLFMSDKTGKIIDPRFTRLSYPPRWRFDILKALDYFQLAKIKYDKRMQPAIDVLLKKQKKDEKWPLQGKHAGIVHFDMEKPGQPSRWNTLRALRVLNWVNQKKT
jgi:hypothetical protein